MPNKVLKQGFLLNQISIISKKKEKVVPKQETTEMQVNIQYTHQASWSGGTQKRKARFTSLEKGNNDQIRKRRYSK